MSVIGYMLFSPVYLIVGLIAVINKFLCRSNESVDQFTTQIFSHIKKKNTDDRLTNLFTSFDVYLIDISHMLYKEKKEVGNIKFMKTLQIMCERDISYLEIPLIQTIIKFKWFAYTRSFFVMQFLLLIVFILSFILDLLF